MKYRLYPGICCFFLLFALGCGGSSETPPPADTTTPDSVEDVEADGTVPDTIGPPKPDTVGEMCNSDNDCDDGLFCNGEETCMPEHIDSDTTGCLDGIPPKSTDDNPIDCRTVLECDEDIDDFPIVNLQGGETCDDGIACTTSDTCDSFGNCQGTPTDSQCDDGLFCNGAETCAFHIGCRAGTPPSPGANADPDPTDCLVPSTCVEATQSFDMAPATAGTLCNDGVDCTFEDACTGAGTCGGVPNDGFCDDGKFCNGSETCDASGGCDAGTAPEAPEDTDLTDCVAPTLCDEATDSFADAPVAEGASCDDGDVCSENDVCTANVCAGAAITCADADACNVGLCVDGTCGTEPAPEGTACGNGGAGSTNECDAQGTCVSTAIVCAANESVSANTCVACPPGTTNAGGDDASGADTACDTTLCAANESVSANTCVACPPGSTNAGGDDASGADTSCEINNGYACTQASECVSGHCQNGFCCASGDCCSDASDCPNTYSFPAVCVDAAICKGGYGDAICSTNMCALQTINDDSVCTATVEANACGLYMSAFCNGQADQTEPVCATACATDADCDANAHCDAANECVLD